MQVYAMKFHNFLRFGEENNTIVFDLTNKQKKDLANGELTMDEIYRAVAADPVDHIERAKKRGLEREIGIIGLVDGDPDSSNGVGKSSIMEGICYAHYEKIVRKTANNDKVGKAGLSVVTRMDGKYPKGMKESFVEEYFEDNGSVYRIKRGQKFSKAGANTGPIHEFECIRKSDIDSRASHRKDDTQEAIEDVITMDYDVFVNSQMFGQSDAGKYLTGTDKIKKEMLISLLRLENVVVGCLELLRQRKNAQEKKVDVIKSNIEFLRGMFCKAYAKYTDKKDLEFEDTMPQEIIDVLMDLKNKGMDKLKKCNAKTQEVQEEIDLLNKSEKLTAISLIKEETQRVKDERVAKEKDQKQQVADWQNLRASSKSEVDRITSEIKAKQAKLEKTQESVVKVKKQISEFDQTEVDRKLAIISSAKAAKPQTLLDIDKCAQKREEAVKGIAGHMSKINELQDGINALKQQIASIQDGDGFVCDKCKSQVAKEHILNEIRNDEKSLRQRKAAASQFELQKKTCEEEMARLLDSKAKIEKYEVAEAKIAGDIKAHKMVKENLETLEASEIDLSKEVSDLQERLRVSEAKHLEYVRKVAEIAAKFDTQIEAIDQRIEKLKGDYTVAKQEAAGVEAKLIELKALLVKVAEVKNLTSEKLGFLDRDLAHHRQLVIDMEAKQKEFTEESKLLSRYLVLETVYGLDGIQTRIVKKYLPLLNVYIKEFLDILSRGAIEVKMEINERSKIDMVISGGSANTYDMLSGGEKMIVRLAVDIGLALLSFSRSSQKPELICLDEIFGPLDNNHTEAVFEMLKKLQNKFSRVLIITHNPEIQAKLNSSIVIEKSAGSLGLSQIKRIE